MNWNAGMVMLGSAHQTSVNAAFRQVQLNAVGTLQDRCLLTLIIAGKETVSCITHKRIKAKLPAGSNATVVMQDFVGAASLT